MQSDDGKLVVVTDADGSVLAADWLRKAESVHRQLRPNLPSDYPARMAEIFAGGARMVLATASGQVSGLAVWRVFADTFNGIRFYVDDLVTDESSRSQGVGHTLIDWLEQEARRCGAGAITLDSGTHRTRAHGFYFREGFVIPSFNFKKQLK